MRKISIILGILMFIAVSTFGLHKQEANPSPYIGQKAKTPEYTYTIVNVYPHDPDAFTQGLIYHKGVLYESTGLYDKSSLRRVELETGKVLQQIKLDKSYFGEGITLWQDRIIQLTWEERIGFVYNRENFKKIRNFTYKTEGWGITDDGQRLIMSDGTNTLHFLDPHTFNEIGSIQVRDGETPVEKLNELEYVNGEIFANVLPTDWIARISPATGRVLGWIDLSGILELESELGEGDLPGELNGIAYDEQGNRLFVTGKCWPKLFEIKLVPEPRRG